MPDIQIIQIDSKTGLAGLGMGRSQKVLTGLDLLVQAVTLAFLKDPGRDVIEPDDGAGLRLSIGQFSFTSVDEIRLMVIQRTKSIEQSLISKQTAGLGDPTERLKKLSILDVAADPERSQVMIRVKIINETGDSAEILV